MLMRSSMLMDSIRSNSVDMLKVQNQLTTGLKIGRPSDSPALASSVMNLDSVMGFHGHEMLVFYNVGIGLRTIPRKTIVIEVTVFIDKDWYIIILSNNIRYFINR